jgi:hypothetical protein
MPGLCYEGRAEAQQRDPTSGPSAHAERKGPRIVQEGLRRPPEGPGGVKTIFCTWDASDEI